MYCPWGGEVLSALPSVWVEYCVPYPRVEPQCWDASSCQSPPPPHPLPVSPLHSCLKTLHLPLYRSHPYSLYHNADHNSDLESGPYCPFRSCSWEAGRLSTSIIGQKQLYSGSQGLSDGPSNILRKQSQILVFMHNARLMFHVMLKICSHVSLSSLGQLLSWMSLLESTHTDSLAQFFPQMERWD